MNEHIELSRQVPEELAGKRLDQALAEMFPDFSRSRLKKWVLDEQVLVDGAARRPRDRLLGGEQIHVDATIAGDEKVQAQPIDLQIVHEDEGVILINKPPGLVVHPGAGNPHSTLQNALLAHDDRLGALPRAGIVHRLDRLTSGLLVVARTVAAHTRLVQALQARQVSRSYQALANGVMTGGGTVDQPIGRHPTHRTRMCVRHDGREAVTHYRVMARFRGHTHIRVNLETGRTHQIRVHMAHVRYALVGDPDYGGRLALPRGVSEPLADALRQFRRQALHAWQLSFVHPLSGEQVSYEAPVPADMVELIRLMREDAARELHR